MEGTHATPCAAGMVADRMGTEGIDVIGDIELLAVIMGGRDALSLAGRVMERVGGLAELGRTEGGAIPKTAGLTPARAARMQAAIELGKRSMRPREPRQRINGPEDLAALLRPTLQHATRERFGVCLLDARSSVIAVRTIAVGSLNASIVHPREVFTLAIVKGCARICLFHCHPSGQPDPSQEDIALTRRLVEVGKLLGIDVVDHIIIGDATFQSLRGHPGIGW